MRRYHMMGTCHVDATWHGDEEQYANYLEQFTVILVDMLQQYPDMTYMIEQAYHYRKLKNRRPDLIEKLKEFIAKGRIEVVGGMLTTADSNMPCAESVVRNQLMGLRWFATEMGAKVETAWLVDAFGSHAQIPQMFNSFGMKQMMSTRFGGDKHHEVFWAEGLDGTRLLVAGRDCFSLNMPAPERTRVVFDYVNDGAMMDALFRKVRKIQLDGPIMVDVYVEDETYPNRRMMTSFHDLQRDAAANGNEAVFSLPRDFFNDLRHYQQQFPLENADLNPEFTGVYSNRVEIRLHNRRTETALLEAEKWMALCGKPYQSRFDDAWWDMSYVHFHDVFTGSHPDKVFQDVICRLDACLELADNAMAELFGSPVIDGETHVLRVTNSLPFARTEWVSVPIKTACTVRGVNGDVPSYLSEGRLWFMAEIDACATAIYSLESAEMPEQVAREENKVVLENEFVLLAVDVFNGVTLTEKESGREILKNAQDLLVLQGDVGNFQIEQIETTEQHAWASPVRVKQVDQHVVSVFGSFDNNEGNIDAEWTLTLSVRPGEPLVGMRIQTGWLATGKRLRLKLNTTLSRAGEGIYEVPFGVVRRRPYTPGFCRKGEWPAQRFAAIEDGEVGIALINDGVPGVEALAGSIYTTLLRSPVQAYAGMVPDCSSSQHGEHDFNFALYVYSGTWDERDLLSMAQRWNAPMRTYKAKEGTQAIDSLLCFDKKTVVLSAVKEIAPNAILLRVYESVGKAVVCHVTLPNAKRAWISNMLEEKIKETAVEQGVLSLVLAPWQILSVYVETGDDKVYCHDAVCDHEV